MTQIRNAAIQQLFNDITGNQTATDGSFSNATPVYEISPKYSFLTRNLIKTTTSSTAIYAVPSDRDFYITSVSIGYAQNAVSDNLYYAICIYQGGKLISLVRQDVLTTTAQAGNIVQSFPYPVKVDRGSNITAACSFTAGALSFNATINGFWL